MGSNLKGANRCAAPTALIVPHLHPLPFPGALGFWSASAGSAGSSTGAILERLALPASPAKAGVQSFRKTRRCFWPLDPRLRGN